MKSIHDKLNKINGLLQGVEVYFLLIFFIIMLAFMSVGVFSRYIFNLSLSGSEAFPVLVLVWISMIGASVGFHKGSHFKLTLFVDFLSPRINKTVSIIVDCLVIFFVIILIYKGFQLVKAVSLQQSFGLRISVAWFYLCVPVGSILICFHILVNILNQLNSK